MKYSFYLYSMLVNDLIINTNDWSFPYSQNSIIKTKGVHVMNNFLSIALFNTKKHSYTVGDMITLFSFMILLCAFAYISLIIGVK